MAVYLKEFSTHSEYDTYINGSGAILPNVSICTIEGHVHYNPWVDTRVEAKYNVTSTSSPTKLYNISVVRPFSSIEIDGVAQPRVVSEYTFSTTGEHTVKYTLTDPTSIGYYVFRECSGLTSIDIPNSVTSIGNGAFYYCTSLTSIDIPNSVTSIGGNAFSSCSVLTSIDIPDSVTSIGNQTFHSCSSLTNVTIGSGVTSIGQGTFIGCSSLTSIDIPDSVTSIDNSVFANCI